MRTFQKVGITVSVMWPRNLFFCLLCSAGVSWLGFSLLKEDGLTPPISFDPTRYARPEYQTSRQQLNAGFRDQWAAADVRPAKAGDELLVARRLALALMGTIPSLEEIRGLQELPASHQIDWWLSRILEDRRYADYVAERFARAFVGTQNGPFLIYRRRRFVSWLSDQLYENRPYDEIVRALVSDGGLWTDSPAVNFVTVTLDENDDGKPDPIRLAARTSRAFLGMRIDCLQCHDDNLGTIQLGSDGELRGGLQSDFHQLAAFYSEAESSLFGIIDGDDPYKYKYLGADEEEEIEPTPPFFPELVGTDGPRRKQLADWLTHRNNKQFARAIVNRTWALLFGRPLVEPVDDIPLDVTELPPALELLTADFIAHDYDLRRLIRLIAGLEVFRLESRADFEVTEKHEAEWAVFPLSRLRPEQTAGALIQSASVKTIDATSHIIFQLQRYNQQDEFITRYGDTGEDEFESRAGTIAQRLLMMNGELVKKRTDVDLMSNAATRIGTLAPTDERAVELAYLTVLSRQPSAAESGHFVELLADSKGDVRSQHMEDIFWVLVNCTEFGWNH
jgi:hypothetical protein